MVWARYSFSSTCIAFVAALVRLLLFAVLFHLLLWWHKNHPGVVLSTRRGWLYPPKGVVVSPERGGFIPHLGVVLCPGPHAKGVLLGALWVSIGLHSFMLLLSDNPNLSRPSNLAGL